jgi:GNAT superfamily N-acetyltransferase
VPGRRSAASRVVIRAAEPVDGSFLATMLATGAFETPGEALADPHVARYLAGWKRRDDIGIVATIDGRPIAAAWCRVLPASEPGYGYVDDQTPELSIGVERDWRGRGIGTLLLRALLREAARAGHRAISLSVSAENAAALRLYRKLGFVVVGGDEGHPTMLRSIAPAGES